MNLKLVSLFVLVASSVSWGQEIFYYSNKPERQIEKMNSDGSSPSTVLTETQVKAALEPIVSEVNLDIRPSKGLAVDSLGGKMYFVVHYTKDGFDLYAVARSNLDGSNIEILNTPTPNAANAGKIPSLPAVFRQSTIPAVGGVGLGILIATLLAGGGWIISRRTGMEARKLG